MNILHTETLKAWGGEQNKVINEMKLARELGHNLFLFCNPDTQIAKVAKELGFCVIAQPMNKKNYHKSVPALCRVIDEKGIDLVISHGSTDSWVAAIAGLFKRKNGVKFARERHNMFPIKSFISRILHKYLFDYIFYISDSVKNLLKDVGVRDKKLIYMPSTIDTKLSLNTKSTFRSEFGIKDDVIVIGTFTSLYRKKGIFELANAAKLVLKEYENAVIVFGGNISEVTKDEVCAIFDAEVKDRIFFTGFRNDVFNVIKSFDVCVFPSHSEGLGTALLEMMSSGVPIVVFDKEPMNILIKHNERGLCAEYLDVDSLATNIKNIINNKKNSNIYATNALEFVKNNYDHQKLKQAIKDFLEKI